MLSQTGWVALKNKKTQWHISTKTNLKRGAENYSTNRCNSLAVQPTKTNSQLICQGHGSPTAPPGKSTKQAWEILMSQQWTHTPGRLTINSQENNSNNLEAMRTASRKSSETSPKGYTTSGRNRTRDISVVAKGQTDQATNRCLYKQLKLHQDSGQMWYSFIYSIRHAWIAICPVGPLHIRSCIAVSQVNIFAFCNAFIWYFPIWERNVTNNVFAKK